MHRRSHRPRRRSTAVAVVAALAFGLTPAAHGDDWARDHAASVGKTAVLDTARSGDDWARDRAAASRALDGLDPAIRTALVAQAAPVSATPSVSATPRLDDGFAWGAAALGLGAGIAAMCVLLGCVTLLRHDGRLRSA